MNIPVLDQIRRVRNLKAGSQSDYVHPAVEPRTEPVEFHFDLFGQQYTAWFGKTGSRRTGPWGEHSVRAEVGLTDEITDETRIFQRTFGTDSAPGNDVRNSMTSAFQNVKNGLGGREMTAPPSLMAVGGPADEAMDRIPYGDDGPGITEIQFEMMGNLMTFEIDSGGSIDDRGVVRNVYLDVRCDSALGSSPVLDDFNDGPHYHYENRDEAVSMFSNAFNTLGGCFRHADEEHLIHFETYE